MLWLEGKFLEPFQSFVEEGKSKESEIEYREGDKHHVLHEEQHRVGIECPQRHRQEYQRQNACSHLKQKTEIPVTFSPSSIKPGNYKPELGSRNATYAYEFCDEATLSSASLGFPIPFREHL